MENLFITTGELIRAYTKVNLSFKVRINKKNLLNWQQGRRQKFFSWGGARWKKLKFLGPK